MRACRSAWDPVTPPRVVLDVDELIPGLEKLDRELGDGHALVERLNLPTFEIEYDDLRRDAPRFASVVSFVGADATLAARDARIRKIVDRPLVRS